jgi:hypothetical protein
MVCTATRLSPLCAARDASPTEQAPRHSRRFAVLVDGGDVQRSTGWAMYSAMYLAMYPRSVTAVDASRSELR